MKRILPPTFLYICLVLMVLLHWLLPLYHLLKFPLTLLGVLPIVAGILVMMAAWLQFRKMDTTHNTFEKPGKMIVEGVYRYTRNPMLSTPS